MRAREVGAEVILLEKAGSITRSGSCASGIDSYKVLLEEAPWDTPEAYLAPDRSRPEDMQVQATFARNSKRVFHYLEDMGVPFRDRITGRYERVVPLGTSHPTNVSFDGAYLKPTLARRVRQLGAKVVERVAVEGLLTRSGRVVGAAGFHIRDGQFYVIKARTVVMTAGGAVRFYPPSSGQSFVTHTPPFNTGDGQAMAFRAGAALTNMEFTASSIEPQGFSAPGLSAFIGLGARLLNARGERYMKRYHHLEEHAPRPVIVRAMLTEMAEGRGPCYFDCRHLSEEQLRRLKRDLANGKPTLLDFFAARGLDLSRDLIPFAPRELDCNGNGIKIDGGCRSSLEGLFAAGNCSSASLALPGACTLGYVAGERAAEEAARNSARVEVDRGQVGELRENVFRPLSGGGEVRPKELEDQLRQVMHDLVGFEREEECLQRALEHLKRLHEGSQALLATSLHELMRANETRNLIEVAFLIARAALERRESRASHYRSDFPVPEDKWKGFVVMSRGKEGQVDLSFQPVPSPGSGEISQQEKISGGVLWQR
jgi:succinate dehydrogenase/fumarate reductase flavoprotein subunit